MSFLRHSLHLTAAACEKLQSFRPCNSHSSCKKASFFFVLTGPACSARMGFPREVGWLDGHMHWIWLRATGDARGDNQFWSLYILPLQLRLFLVFHSWGQVYTATCHCMASVLLSCLCSTPLQHSCSSSTHAGMNAHYVMRLLELDNQPLASTLRSHLLQAMASCNIFRWFLGDPQVEKMA